MIPFILISRTSKADLWISKPGLPSPEGGRDAVSWKKACEHSRMLEMGSSDTSEGRYQLYIQGQCSLLLVTIEPQEARLSEPLKVSSQSPHFAEKDLEGDKPNPHWNSCLSSRMCFIVPPASSRAFKPTCTSDMFISVCLSPISQLVVRPLWRGGPDPF